VPRTAAVSESEGQGQHLLSLLFALLGRRDFVVAIALALLFASPFGHSIPVNTPITNTATVAYSVDGVTDDGVTDTRADSDTVLTDPDSGNSPPHGLSLLPAQADENAIAVAIGDLVVVDLDHGRARTSAACCRISKVKTAQDCLRPLVRCNNGGSTNDGYSMLGSIT
jgi:hypothetical protein